MGKRGNQNAAMLKPRPLLGKNISDSVHDLKRRGRRQAVDDTSGQSATKFCVSLQSHLDMARGNNGRVIEYLGRLN